MKTYDLQLYICAALMILSLIGLQQDIFTIAEGILAFALGIGGFIHAGIQLILED